MSISDKQLAANRANARKSTGPNTPEGIAALAFNNLRHGLYSRLELLPGEDPEEFQAWGHGIRADLNPVGDVEGSIADRIVSVSWRIRRVGLAECAVFSPDAAPPGPPPDAAPPDAASLAPSADSSAPPPLSPGAAWLRRVRLTADPLAGISRHESRLHHQLCRDLLILERRQAARLSRQSETSAPAPAVERRDKFGRRITRYSCVADHVLLLQMEEKLGVQIPDGTEV